MIFQYVIQGQYGGIFILYIFSILSILGFVYGWKKISFFRMFFFFILTLIFILSAYNTPRSKEREVERTLSTIKKSPFVVIDSNKKVDTRIFLYSLGDTFSFGKVGTLHKVKQEIEINASKHTFRIIKYIVNKNDTVVCIKSEEFGGGFSINPKFFEIIEKGIQKK